MKVSFIGLGNMGKPLAERVLAAGYPLAVWTSNPQTAAHFARLGATVVDEKADLANCDILFTCVPRPEDVRLQVAGKEGLYKRMKQGSVHVDLSTIDPDTAEELEREAMSLGIGYVQSTVSKTPKVAAEGEAPLFVGGVEQAVTKVWPLLEKMGRPENVGSARASCVIKILSNQMVMAILGVVSEGLKIGELASLDQKRLLELLLSSGASSFQLSVRGPMIVERDFAPRFAVDLALKDLRLGEKMLKKLHFEPRLISQALAYMEKASEAGLSEEDMSAIYKVLDR